MNMQYLKISVDYTIRVQVVNGYQQLSQPFADFLREELTSQGG